MKFWIWSVSIQNWPTVKEKKIWAVDTKGKGKDVQPGDKIIFYVNSTLYFHGIFEVKNEWHESTMQWPSESSIGEYTESEINLEEIQLGFGSIKKLFPLLHFVEKKKSGLGIYLRGSPHGPSNFGKSISENDYNLILNELKNNQIEPNFEKIKETENDIEELIELSSKSFEIAKIPTPDKKTLSDIFQDVEAGRYAIPDFQRYWTWNKKQIEELWESIFQNYYVGSLLFWSTREKKLGTTSVQGTLNTIDSPYLILDGQQRITAIYYAVKSPNIPLPNTEKSYEFFLNINALLNTESDGSEIIDSYDIKKIEKQDLRNPLTQYKKKVFPLTAFRDDGFFQEWLFDFYKYLKDSENYNDSDASKYFTKLNGIFHNVWKFYEIPVVILSESLHLDNVATVFERINSKGTQLGIFDLLNARFIIHDIVLKNMWEEAQKTHVNMKKWYHDYNHDKIPLYIIQAITLSKSKFMRRKYILNLDEQYKISNEFQSDNFLQDWKEMSDYIEEAIIRFTSMTVEGFGAPNYNFIPYTILVPLFASLLKEIHDKPNRASCYTKIKFWYWNNILGDRYSGSTESTVEVDFKNLKKWFNDDTENPFETETRSDFNTSKNTSALFKAIMCLIAKKGALDFIRDDPLQYSKLEDHHIFPKSKAKDFDAENEIDSVLNRTLISGDTHQSIGNKIPSQYLSEIMEKGKIDKDALKKRLSTHLISDHAFDCLMNDDFKGFIKERQDTISKEFHKLISLNPDELYTDIQEILNHEDQNVEFKETLRWDVRTNRVNHTLEEAVAKEIAGFMNATGGKLFIGVDDHGHILGLERDYETLKKQDSDGFQLHITNIVNKYLGKIPNVLITWSFLQSAGKEICLGEISGSTKPVFVKINNENNFYVRVNNSCEPFDAKDGFDYISEHWGSLE